jgi:hypothetical protein
LAANNILVIKNNHIMLAGFTALEWLQKKAALMAICIRALFFA